jgi:hypothetical protein
LTDITILYKTSSKYHAAATAKVALKMSTVAIDFPVDQVAIANTGTEEDVINVVNISFTPNHTEWIFESQNKWLHERSVDVGRPGPQWAFLALGVFPIWMLAGNCLVLLALLLQRNLQNLSNRVIASLAVTDFLLALFVVPLSIYQLVRVKFSWLFYSSTMNCTRVL